MTELLTAAQMKAIEAAAIASGEVTGLELMERAGAGVVQAVFDEWPDLAAGPHRAVVLCGPGGNGGDGFVVARLLKEAGWAVEVFLYGDPDRLPPDARVNYERWRGMGEVSATDEDALRDGEAENMVVRFECERVNLVVDALFGIGLSRPVESGLCVLFQWIELVLYHPGHRYNCRVVSVDVPSGLCSDSGIGLDSWPDRRSDYNIVRSHLTVTFEVAKPGHYLEAGPDYCGKLVVQELQIERRLQLSDDHLQLTSVYYARNFWPVGQLEKRQNFHKYCHGHALILSGGVGHGGAARLAARGALRIGAGLVTIGCPPAALIENAAHLNAIMLKRVPDADALAEILTDTRITALCLGPGMGTGQREAALLAVALECPPPSALSQMVEGSRLGQAATPANALLPLPPVGRGEGWVAKRPTVLDADALTLLSQNPTLFTMLHKDCILTPHAGEFARLFPDIAAKLAESANKGPAYSKVDATRDAAIRAGCVVLFKGPDTVIADPSGRCSINSAHYDRAAPWLATAGSGDVLAGFITGLLARGFAPMQAAETAAWLHVECARSFGPGLIAEDLPEELPKVLRGLGA